MVNNLKVKKMETDDEIRGKAYVHWKAWHEAYPGLVDQGYLEDMTLEKCEKIAYSWPDNLIVAKDNGRVIGFVGYGDRGNVDESRASAAYELPAGLSLGTEKE